ncbi:MAG: TusE/DsrC/DsvC family sulfur relay protein [Anaerolineales bacterium]|uniref:TusE/DsrC/DsvC family sulfur relay protein n=1 Tax=Candidatus Desulfolinea nitratireducens TaxID=2841698 RepID=A0A8J6NHQ2_9CHLR|nr:TusE/DsrC/DsvC family sulfur relay protein [Candidatus Desulfolinea nitratireducens]MBL6960716.1 TusE/DsrC/DsvC family sulfur relay protein [Anaerolineales bacterium]
MTALNTITLNEEGFMTNPAEWTEDIATVLAEKEGITLTDAHWAIINFSREKAADSGAAPTLRQITQGIGITTKELFALYPKGPAKKVAKISGLGKPEGCV